MVPDEFVGGTYGTYVGVVLSSILLTLDAGLQLQRYPAPMIYGGYFGYAFGRLLDLCLERKRNKI